MVERVNSAVYYYKHPVVPLGAQDLQFLLERVEDTPHKRIRLCAHLTTQDALHEMFIAVRQGSYIRPHKHINKAESIHLILGYADVVLFDDAGAVVEVLPLGPYESGHPFYYRMSMPCYHTFIVKTDLLFHETTTGPFDPADTLFAPWSPEETDPEGIRAFMEDLTGRVEKVSAPRSDSPRDGHP